MKISDEQIRTMLQEVIRQAMNPPSYKEWKEEYLRRARVELINIAADRNLSLSNKEIEVLAHRVINLYADDALDMHGMQAVEAVLPAL
jgi:hypothetical protein